MLLAGTRHRGAGDTAHRGTDGGPGAAAGNAADDRAKARAAAHFPRRLLAFAFALGLDVATGHFVDLPAETNRVQLEGDLVAALELAGLLDVDRLQRGAGAAGN